MHADAGPVRLCARGPDDGGARVRFDRPLEDQPVCYRMCMGGMARSCGIRYGMLKTIDCVLGEIGSGQGARQRREGQVTSRLCAGTVIK